MGLKAPGIVTFTLSIVLVVIATISKFARADLPWIMGHEFFVVLVAFLILVSGCMVRRL
ncbi:MAG: hypothetical protein ACK5JT_05660 [Hyphomicrobiaceae bacterium]